MRAKKIIGFWELKRKIGSGNYGKFIDLMDNGKEILATTEKGLFYSTNKGLSWNVRKRG